jgi:hypothetical protein
MPAAKGSARTPLGPTNLLVDRLEELIWQIDAKLENVKTKERKLRQLPKGKMMLWDTSVESYHD